MRLNAYLRHFFVVATIFLVLLAIQDCGGSGASNSDLTFGPGPGYKFSVTNLTCEGTLEISKENGGFTGSSYTVEYSLINEEGDATSTTYTDNAPMVLNGMIDTFMSQTSEKGTYEVSVGQGGNYTIVGYIDYTGCQ